MLLSLMDTQFKYEIRSLQLFWTLFWKIKVATEKCFKKSQNVMLPAVLIGKKS